MYNKELQQITAPVTINDVQRALGLGTSSLQSLCTSDRVNMLSKSKPVAHADFRTPEWWRGSGNCGVNIPATTDDINRHFAPQQWAYQKQTAMFWLSDFSGYVHSAAYVADFGGLNITPLSPIRLCVSNYIINDKITGSIVAVENGVNGLLGLREILNLSTATKIFVEVAAINDSLNPSRSSRIYLNNTNIYNFSFAAPTGCAYQEDVRIALIFGYINSTGTAVYLSPNCANSSAVDTTQYVDNDADISITKSVSRNIPNTSYTMQSIQIARREYFPYNTFYIRINHTDDRGIVLDKELTYSDASTIVPVNLTVKAQFKTGDQSEIDRAFQVGIEVYATNNYNRRILIYADQLN